MASLRFIAAMILSLSIIAISSPLHAQPPQETGPTCCCKHTSHQAGAHHHGCGEPAKSRDQQCCLNCPIGLTLLPASQTKIVFQRRDVEHIVVDPAFLYSRTDRPPVPPPRVWPSLPNDGLAQSSEVKCETKIGGIMKFLFIILTAAALLSTANATSRSADCCRGEAKCCPGACCKK